MQVKMKKTVTTAKFGLSLTKGETYDAELDMNNKNRIFVVKQKAVRILVDKKDVEFIK